MTAALRRHLSLVILILGWLAAWGICAVTVYRGDWSAFGHFVMQFPGLVKTSGWHGPDLVRWLEGLAAAYAVLLGGGIFFGLRRVRKGPQ